MDHPYKHYLIYTLHKMASKAENMEAWHRRLAAAVAQTKSLLGALKQKHTLYRETYSHLHQH
jgi:hypothetical protein